MTSYPCDTCGTYVEIEEAEAFFGNNEAFEFGQCQKCFDKAIRENK
jgi:hypothetical protein